MARVHGASPNIRQAKKYIYIYISRVFALDCEIVFLILALFLPIALTAACQVWGRKTLTAASSVGTSAALICNFA